MAAAPPVEPNSTPMRTASRARFELELEFVQALANPFYLENLASEGLLEDQAFINYLQYLQYWRKSEYARFIVYPHCLHFLELLQHEQFRNELKNPVTRMRLEHYQFEHWRTWRSGPPQPTEEQQPQAADEAKTPGLANPSTTPGPGRNSATPGPGRGSATPAVSRRGSTHTSDGQAATRSRSRRKGLFSRDNQHKSDPLLDKDPHVLAARDKLAAAERAEQEADRALEHARRTVIEARDHCKQLESQAVEEARLAKAKRSEAKGLGKQARGLGRHS
ncbi:suppressor of hpr1 [Ceratobasidium sp. 423]|nr:suppressor of hpr1 [Ceratobasidium sp. 423]